MVLALGKLSPDLVLFCEHADKHNASKATKPKSNFLFLNLIFTLLFEYFYLKVTQKVVFYSFLYEKNCEMCKIWMKH
ncbi:hypothetical protein LHEJCM20397_06620 [Lactobacillus helveticus]|nr:hypothetical protein LHEJCM1006_06280 [Lactobacillus helveticus]GFP17114.1 hypothetical protein LHEJCM20397_06620 [Lactobacillus helveticus]GIP66516.1 hypothetical protein LhelvAHU1049_07210 [Lactobacillus helveticus]